MCATGGSLQILLQFQKYRQQLTQAVHVALHTVSPCNSTKISKHILVCMYIYHIAGRLGGGKIWRIDSFRAHLLLATGYNCDCLCEKRHVHITLYTQLYTNNCNFITDVYIFKCLTVYAVWLLNSNNANFIKLRNCQSIKKLQKYKNMSKFTC